MTHEKLLEKINIQGVIARAGVGGWIKGINALRAVVELHKPIDKYPHLCNGCYEEESGPSDYPCPTIQAIEKELL